MSANGSEGGIESETDVSDNTGTAISDKYSASKHSV